MYEFNLQLKLHAVCMQIKPGVFSGSGIFKLGDLE